ncbi:MAG: general secretion pathway protein GspK [Kiloniellales bacterium]
MTPKTDSRGVALVIVLWLLALMAGLAAAVAATARTETHLARNLVEEARARQLAQAGIYHAIVRLFQDQRDLLTLPPDGSTVASVGIGGRQVRYVIRDECGKIDLNTGRGGLILGLILANGVEDRRATSIAQAILDWRDPDHRVRARGAEDREYKDAGLAYGARDGLFESIEELQQVLGIGPALYRRLAPDITVNCLDAGVEPLAASPTVLAAIPNVDPIEVEAFLRARRAARQDEAAGEPPSLAGGGRYVEGSAGQVYAISAMAETPNGARVRWEAVVWLTGDRKHPYAIRRWQRVPTAPLEAGAGGEVE